MVKRNFQNRNVQTVTHWGAYNVEVNKGGIVGVQGLGSDSDPSAIGMSMVGTLDDKSRITDPMVRSGFLKSRQHSDSTQRGLEPFVPISWDLAEELVAEELARVRRDYGNKAIFGGSYGWASAGRFHHAQSQLHRFLNCLGGYTRSVNTYSFAAAEVILPHILGDYWAYISQQTTWPSIVENTELVVAFGGLPLKNTQVSPGGTGNHAQKSYMQQAKEKGVEFVNISPIRDDVADFLHAEWYAARPNTDVAIMLGIAYTLVTENRHSEEFLQEYCVGFEKFHSYLMGEVDGQPKDASWAANVSGLSAEQIISIARLMTKKRTMISLSWSLVRQDHGEQTYWMGVTLAAMLGQIGLPGGGVGFGYAAENTMGNQSGEYPLASLPQGKNDVDQFIPVARISDMLLQPGEVFDYDGQKHTYPDIELIYWAGGNPFHHHQDTNRLLKAWRIPQTIIVHDIWWNATARLADIVLPATSALERNDIGGASNDPYLFPMHQVVRPNGNARNDFEIFSGIARKLDVAEKFDQGRDEMAWIRHLYEVTADRFWQENMHLPPFESFWESGECLRLPVPKKHKVILAEYRSDPDANRLSTPSGRIEIYSEAISKFGYEDCVGHPIWMEPKEWLGQNNRNNRFHLISNQPSTRLHSQLDNGVTSRNSKINGREPVRINSKDAKKLGVIDNDIVRLYNERGQCLAGAVTCDDLLPGVVQMSTGAWWDPEDLSEPNSLCRHGHVNVLTIDKGTSSLAQGPIALTCLVNIEKFEGTVTEINVFNPPSITDAD